MSCDLLIPVNSGTSLTFPLLWQNADTTPLDTTGMTIVLFDLAGDLAGRLSVAAVDESVGEYAVTLQGITPQPLPPGDYGWRARLVPAIPTDDAFSTGPLMFRVI